MVLRVGKLNDKYTLDMFYWSFKIQEKYSLHFYVSIVKRVFWNILFLHVDITQNVFYIFEWFFLFVKVLFATVTIDFFFHFF